jgi:hypothetical protein
LGRGAAAQEDETVTSHPLAFGAYMTVAALWIALMYAALIREPRERPRPKCERCAEIERENQMGRDTFRMLPGACAASLCLLLSLLWPVSLAKGLSEAGRAFHRHG